MMRLYNLNLFLLLGLSTSPAYAIRGRAEALHDLGHVDRFLEVEQQTITIGRDETVSIAVDQAAASGALSYGDKVLIMGPPVCGNGRSVKCSATLNANLVNMQFYLRKAISPDRDEEGGAKDFDCEANSDTNLVSPDNESCTVTNFQICPAVDAVVGYISITDNGINLDKEYDVNFRCDIIDSSSSSLCFSKDSSVTVLGKGSTRMENLQVGDKVLVENRYEPVYAFAHLDKTTSAEFLQIHTEDQEDPLEVTKDHLVFVNNKYIPAGNIKVGDMLSNGPVEKIDRTEKAGLYAPLTPSGSVNVNGVKASNYVSFQQKGGHSDTGMIGENIDTGLSFHFINHIAGTPLRLACLGISSRFCDAAHIDEESGLPSFVRFWFLLIEFFKGQILPFQLVLMAVFFGIVAPLYAVESICGPTHAPMLLALAILGIAVIKQGKQQKIKQV